MAGSPAGVFNYSLKSGANEPHGSVLWGATQRSVNANTFTNKFAGLPRNFDRKQNAAVSFGGPIIIPQDLPWQEQDVLLYGLRALSPESDGGAQDPTPLIR